MSLETLEVLDQILYILFFPIFAALIILTLNSITNNRLGRLTKQYNRQITGTLAIFMFVSATADVVLRNLSVMAYVVMAVIIVFVLLLPTSNTSTPFHSRGSLNE